MTTATGSWRQVLIGSGRPSSLLQAVGKALLMAAVLIPVCWAFADVQEALRYSAMFVGVLFVVDVVLLLWNRWVQDT